MKRLFTLIICLAFAMCAVGCQQTTVPAQESTTAEVGAATTEVATTDADNLKASLALNIDDVIGTDGQPLLLTLTGKEIPERPADPSALPETDPLHWYDMEFAGWGATNKTVPESPKSGSIGKHIIYIINGDAPYLTALTRGAETAGEALGMTVDVQSPNWDLNVQNQLIDQAINAKPDLIILIPLDANAAVQQYRKINQAGVPVISAGVLPDAEAMQYVLTWCGADDFGQMSLLANAAGEACGGEGGVCYMTHTPGSSNYYARYNRFEAELAQKYPNMKTLDAQSPGVVDADKARQVVSDWITRFGDELKLIQLADDGAQAVGTIEAIKASGREDIIVTSAGNSKVGMDGIIAGDIYAITYQSAEADGAVAVKLAADWFNGVELLPMNYLPQHVMTAADVEDFLPAQW
jgi:ABC-type sugar transport system substrate-binding protein